MRYLIIIVCIILAGVALMPVVMNMGRYLKAYFDKAIEPTEAEQTKQIDEEEDK